MYISLSSSLIHVSIVRFLIKSFITSKNHIFTLLSVNSSFSESSIFSLAKSKTSFSY